MKKLLALALVVITLWSSLPQSYAAAIYKDVPEGWAKPYVYAAQSHGLMQGVGDGLFGYGREISRGEFISIVCRMFGWAEVKPAAPTFSDVDAQKWYYGYVEGALAHQVMEKSERFRPDEPITREEMAVMLVCAMGLRSAAALPGKLPFTDVVNDGGYIGIVYDLGITTGTSSTTFSPKGTAKREEAAAMLVRTMEKYNAKPAFVHGFYAFSSYAQREITKDMDVVTVGWSCMEMAGADKSPKLNTGSSNGNQWKIPESYDSILNYFTQNGTKTHLGVYMDTTTGLKDLLRSKAYRTQAVGEIMGELTRSYEKIGKNPYSGVTIDFEGLKTDEMKGNFNAFLEELSVELKKANKALFVTVQPILPDGVYYDGYDYRAIGDLSDKVIVMAHDYNATSLKGLEGSEWHKNTPLTPIAQVYYGLKMATDATTGVKDKSKVLLAISFATIGWELNEQGKVASPNPVRPGTETVHSRLMAAGTVRGFSETYRNPYITYQTEEGKRIFLWYEDEQSVNEKISLGSLFDLGGISLWRIGTVPNYEGYCVLGRLSGRK